VLILMVQVDAGKQPAPQANNLARGGELSGIGIAKLGTLSGIRIPPTLIVQSALLPNLV
jgi:hypothetical protein